MIFRYDLAACCCLLLLSLVCAPAMAQELPQDCQEAMAVRSPQGQVDLFTQCLNSGQVSGSAKATTLKQRAIAYMHLGQHQRAVDDINEAVRIRPGDADNYYLRGVALRALGKYDQALEDTNRAIGIEPDNAGAYANRAFIYKALGNANQAKADARRARELDPRVKAPSF
jgi:Lipoprotein NlpI, contains TPR repeats